MTNAIGMCDYVWNRRLFLVAKNICLEKDNSMIHANVCEWVVPLPNLPGFKYKINTYINILNINFKIFPYA